MQDTSPKPPSLSPPSLYEADFYAWTNQQAALLRAGRLGDADIANIAEEIESMGKSEKRELISRLAGLLMHLLKWRYQPGKRGKSWSFTIRGQRLELRRHLRDNPSLKSQMDVAMADAYESAVLEAARETALDENLFPQTCQWSHSEIMDDGFWPEA